MTAELVIFVGLQGSGKSTFYRTHFADSHVLVSRDSFPNNRNPARRQRQLIEEALGAGRSVIVDNTNPTLEDRAELISLARAFGATVVAYYFESRLADCLERNRQRPGKASVPVVALYATRKRVQHSILDQFFGEQPVGTAFVLATNHSDVPFLAHAPTMRVPGNIEGTDKVYAATWSASAYSAPLRARLGSGHRQGLRSHLVRFAGRPDRLQPEVRHHVVRLG
jgi:predicted kinase